MQSPTANVDSLPPEPIKIPKPRPPRSALRRKLDHWWATTKWAALRWIYRREIAKLSDVFGAEPFAAILDRYPGILDKPVRPYLLYGLKWQNRAPAVIDHYQAAARLLTNEAFVESHIDGVRLLTLPTDAGEVSADLAGQGGLYREAEWRLVLCVDARPVMEMGLAIVNERNLKLDGSADVLWIGVLKTALAGTHGLDDARALTKAMEGLRPKSLLLLVAQALAKALNLGGLFGVSNKGHVFAGDYSLRRRIKADYDSFWLECSGENVRPTLFALPLVKAQRDPSEYKPNKRAQVRRRQQLELDIEKLVREAIEPLLRR